MCLVVLWVGSQVLQLYFGILAIRQQPDANNGRRLTSLTLSGIASMLPFFTLLLFLFVFVIGGSSNVAQRAGQSGMDLWGLWFDLWPLLYFGNPPAFFVVCLAALLPPYPPNRWHSFASRVCAIFAAGFAWFIVVMCFPDA